VKELKSNIASMGEGTAQRYLLEKVQELEAQIDALSVGGDDQARAATDKSAYCHAKVKIEEMMTSKRMLREKKATEAEQNSEACLALIVEMRLQLTQIEQEFTGKRNEARAQWLAKNEATDENAKAALLIADQRILSSGKANSAVGEGNAANGNSAVTTPTPAGTVQKVEDEVPKWYKQKTHAATIDPKDLADTKEINWNGVKMDEVHRVWHMLQATQLQPPSLAYSYEMFGISAPTLETIVGTKVIAKIFGGGAVVAPEDIIPDQVINLLRVQMQKLSERLHSEREQYAKAQDEADAAMTKYLPALQNDKKKRGARPY
jgi:hypothetical protein